jgi:hypothetical protein
MMGVWLDRLGIMLGAAHIVASDTASAKDLDDVRVALASVDAALNDFAATMPAAGGAAGAARRLSLLVAQCLASERDEPSRMRLRAAITLTKEQWSHELPE